MKKPLHIILLTFCWLTVFGQYPTRYVNLLPAYPPAIGETQFENFVYSNSGLYMYDIILDSLPQYEIEHIPDQTVRYFEDGIGFYVKADSLHSSNIVFSYEVDPTPLGSFEFNAATGRFKYYPDAGDYMSFTVTFTATSEQNSLSQAVEFNMIPEVVPENLAIQSLGEMPSEQNYTIIAESQTQMYLNNAFRTVHSYSISGKDIIFDNKVWGLSGREDLYELNLFAERLYIRSALAFPHTNINIFAREIIFEDNGDEIASINTTPSAFSITTNETGMDGESAGNITLNIKTLNADYAKRFILNGAQGQSANYNGTPGDGGNGGVLIAPIDIENYCDFSRGSGGVRYKVAGQTAPDYGPIIGAGQVGENGHFELASEKYSWIHPYYFAAVIRHINDAYLNNYFSYSKTTANDYYNLIHAFMDSDEWEDLDATLQINLQDQLYELEGMLYRLNENLDYFGYPLGWAPMLSFEVYLLNYSNEIERAMPTLYLNYWLQHINKTQDSWIEASEFAASQTQSEIEAAQNQINSLIEDIPVLEDKIDVLQNQIETTQHELELTKARLLRKAKHNVEKKNWLNKAFGFFKAALNCIPVVGGIASGVVSTIETVVDYAAGYFGISDSYGIENALTNTFQSITNFDYSAALGNLKQTLNSIDLSNLGQTSQNLMNSYNNLKSDIEPVYNSITNLHNVLAQSTAPNDQVQAEFDKLCSQSVEFQNIKKEIAILQQQYEEFAAILTQTFVTIVNLTSEVSNEMITLDALRNDVFQGNSSRDLQAMQCIEKMKQRAMNRLVKYHYYMRKAYEYRLLKPYQSDFSLENLYERLEAMINQGQVIFDNSTPATFTDYSTLSALFEDDLSEIIDEVLEESHTEQSASISIVLPHEVLDIINANEEYNLNLFELGVLSPDEENIRITGFDVQYIEAHTKGNVGMTTYMNIDLKHNGISRFRKNGEIYWFNHISKSAKNPYPNKWTIRYDPIIQHTEIVGPSAADSSLLFSLLGSNANNNIMLFSRPAAWSDIFMSKKVHSSGDADVVIDSLILSLHYDFTPRPDEIRNIDITTSDDLLVYITCSEADKNGRSNGKGSFHRSYNRSSGTVTFTAMEKHGNYHFVNWSDRSGNVVSENTALTINKMTDQFYRANYELWIPVINVADTIYVGREGGEYEVQIRNVGLGDIEMDWYVSDSLSTWAHVDGVPQGIDDGFFTFTYESNENNGIRLDSLEILAPEIEGMSKTVYIVQYDNSYYEVNASVESEEGGSVVGAGFYEEGGICTLTATANEGYIFVNWTENGEMVSTEATYSFIVTGNRHLIANFIHEYHWDVNIYNYSSSMTIVGIIHINGVEQMTNELEIGAFCGNECRGREQLTDRYYSDFGHYYVFLTFYGNAGNNISFRLYNHALGKELDLACSTLTFVPHGVLGDVSNPYVFDFNTSSINQTSSFITGWNWWSCFIDSDDLLDQIETGLGEYGQIIKSQNQFTQYSNNTWMGNLNSINNESTYLIQTDAVCELVMVGPEARPEDHPIILKPGWNWIGFPSKMAVSVTSAFSNTTPTNGDVVKTQNNFSQYINNYGWFGGLQTINPSSGLLYLSNNSQNTTLVYPDSNRQIEVETNVTNDNNHWKNDIHAYPNNMAVTAVIELDGIELEDENYEIAAFSNGECRGSTQLMYIAPTNRHMAFLTVSGDEPTDLYFSLYNRETSITEVQDQTYLRFETNAIIGNIKDPYVIRFGGSTNSVVDYKINVFPNPVIKGENININITAEDLEKTTIEMINALGVVVETVCEPSLPTIAAPNSAGVYTLRFTIDGKGTYYRNLVVR